MVNAWSSHRIVQEIVNRITAITLDDLYDVSVDINKADGYFLYYDASDDTWKAKEVKTSLSELEDFNKESLFEGAYIRYNETTQKFYGSTLTWDEFNL
jgi:hypothetical protein